MKTPALSSSDGSEGTQPTSHRSIIVAQIFKLLYRRFATCRTPDWSGRPAEVNVRDAAA